MSALTITCSIFMSLNISVFILCGSWTILVSHETPWMAPIMGRVYHEHLQACVQPVALNEIHISCNLALAPGCQDGYDDPCMIR